MKKQKFTWEEFKKGWGLNGMVISDTKENMAKFEKFGYGIEFMSENELIFRKVPQMIAKVNPKEILADILENINGDIDNLEEKIGTEAFIELIPVILTDRDPCFSDILSKVIPLYSLFLSI